MFSLFFLVFFSRLRSQETERLSGDIERLAAEVSKRDAEIARLSEIVASGEPSEEVA
jgi:hypothetical protein